MALGFLTAAGVRRDRPPGKHGVREQYPTGDENFSPPVGYSASPGRFLDREVLPRKRIGGVR